MITGRRSSFEARCRQRGYTLDEVRPCILSEDGDTITVDETHPAYPRERPPGILRKAAHFAASAAKHIAAGAPRASQEEIDRRCAICRACPHFDGHACRKCGCPVKRERVYISKLAWAGESCPDTPPRWGPADTK